VIRILSILFLQTIVCGFIAATPVYRPYSREHNLKPETAFGEILRQLRKQARFSQERLAQESSLDRTYISLLERGLRQPSLTSILQLSRALNISSSEFVSKVEAILNEDKKD